MRTLIRTSLIVLVLVGWSVTAQAQTYFPFGGVAIGTTTSGVRVGPFGCAVTTASPTTYTTGQVHPCSLTTTGGLRVVIIDPVTGAAFSPASDGIDDAAGPASGPSMMGFADETSTDSVDEGDTGKVRMTLDRVQWTAPAAVAATSQGFLTHFDPADASTNATSVKASAGNVYGFSLSNTTATKYYLRMYNLATAPTCSSATGFVETIPIPASTDTGGRERWHLAPQSYTTGVAYCITAGSSSTDNTSAAAGVFVTIGYK